MSMPAKRTRGAGGGASKGPQTALREYAPLTFPIVGVGASAGGIEAAPPPAQTLHEHPGLAVVIVQHQEPNRASGLPQVLSRVTSLEVTEARDGEAVLPDHVYVSPPSADVTIPGGMLHLGSPPKPAALPIHF